MSQTGIYTPMFMAALFKTAKKWKQSQCSLTEEWIKKYDIYIQWPYKERKERENSDKFYNMNEP